MTPPRLELSASKRSKAKNSDRRYLILLGLVVLLAAAISWATRDTLGAGRASPHAAAVTDTVPAGQSAGSPAATNAAPLAEGIM